jgi:hypothetical protein
VWLRLHGKVSKTNRKEVVPVARKRMYDNGVTSSDDFISMPSSAQALYFHLNQMADDDGFNNQIQMAMMMAHASTDDLRVLMAKSFIIRFECGVIVIKHWRLHNTLRKDRYTPTNYQEEFRMLGIKENGAYTLGCQTVANGLPDGCPSIDKNSKDKDSLVEDSIGGVAEDINVPSKPTTKRFAPPTVEQVAEYCLERNNGIDPQRFVDYYTSNGWMVGKNKMKDWKAAVRTWEKNTASKPEEAPKNANPFLDMVGDMHE